MAKALESGREEVSDFAPRITSFEIPKEILDEWNHTDEGQNAEESWIKTFSLLGEEEQKEFEDAINLSLPENFDDFMDEFISECQLSQETGSNNTNWSGSKAIQADDFSGNYIFYGVREFAMTAIMNGMCLHGGFRPYGGTFLVFLDYARNAVRMAALMEIPNILV